MFLPSPYLAELFQQQYISLYPIPFLDTFITNIHSDYTQRLVT